MTIRIYLSPDPTFSYGQTIKRTSKNSFNLLIYSSKTINSISLIASNKIIYFIFGQGLLITDHLGLIYVISEDQY